MTVFDETFLNTGAVGVYLEDPALYGASG